MSEALSAAAPAPVMDVVAPPVEKIEKVEKTEAVAEKPKAEAEIDPVDKLAEDDRKSQAALAQAKDEVEAEAAKRKAAAKQPTATTHGNGVGMAITATVVIVFGLAILATFAYMQTNK